MNETQMETTTEFADTTDHSVYGLVVFLVILVFFASLTTGLILCLLKIWCTFHQQRRDSTIDQKFRRSIAHGSPNFDSDSDEESDNQIQMARRRFSQRIMSFVSRTGVDKKDCRKISQRLESSYDAVEAMMAGLQCETPNKRKYLDVNDPTAIIDV